MIYNGACSRFKIKDVPAAPFVYYSCSYSARGDEFHKLAETEDKYMRILDIRLFDTLRDMASTPATIEFCENALVSVDI